MEYEFDRVIDRRNTGSYKWDIPENELAMWVADMDFQTAPEIREALQKRVAHGIFGYETLPEEWTLAYQHWWKKRHDFAIEKDWLIFCTGVVPAISTAVRKLTTPAEKVLIQTPVYNIFFNSIVNNGRYVVESPLVYENGQYHMDFDDLEQKLSDPQVTLMILCNPHNPVGKIWDVDTLKKVGALCRKYHVTVVSDEIHCDITEPREGYVPFASVSETCKNISVTCIAPTKAFNIAGLQTAAVVVPEESLRHKMWRALNTDEVAEPNAFAVTAAVAAFEQGGDWLDALRQIIKRNRDHVAQYLKKELPMLYLVPSKATYLLWIDCSKVTADTKKLADYLRRETGLYLSDGAQYGACGKTFVRLNIACPMETLQDGLERLRKGIREYRE